MLRRFSITVSLLVLVSLQAMAGSIWRELQDGGGDTGRFPDTAQVTLGAGSLTDIIGTLADGVEGADMYLIRITDFANFSAITSPLGKNGVLDPALYLFDLSGHGVYANDNISNANTQAMLPAGNANGPMANGLYFILIAPSGNDPLNKFGNSIFPCGCMPGVFGPQTKNTVIEHYTNFGIGPDGSGRYDIALTGAAFANPEPGTLGLMAVGLLGGLLARRRYFSSTKFPANRASIPEE